MYHGLNQEKFTQRFHIQRTQTYPTRSSLKTRLIHLKSTQSIISSIVLIYCRRLLLTLNSIKNTKKNKSTVVSLIKKTATNVIHFSSIIYRSCILAVPLGVTALEFCQCLWHQNITKCPGYREQLFA